MPKAISVFNIGAKFELGNDHKPLLALFEENRTLPPMVAGRQQRCP